jgi:hypothetical protein
MIPEGLLLIARLVVWFARCRVFGCGPVVSIGGGPDRRSWGKYESRFSVPGRLSNLQRKNREIRVNKI